MGIRSDKISLQNALNRVQALCARQERCSFDIILKLRQWDVSSKDIEVIIAKLIEDGFINDQRFASMYVRDKIKFNKWGPVKISQALRLKKIPDSTIRESLKEFADEKAEDIILELLKKKAKTIKSNSAYELKSKLVRFGLSRGFEYDTILKIIDKCY